MKKGELKGKDLLLALLYIPGKTGQQNEPIVGRTRLTKMIYLFRKELYPKFSNISEESLPEFFAYDYGPFSKDLLNDIRFFVMLGFINEEQTENEMQEVEAEEYSNDIEEDRVFSDESYMCEDEMPKEYRYSLTKKGIEYTQKNIMERFTDDQRNILIRFKKKINSLTLDQILSYVYNKYSEDAANSKIKGKYIKA